MFVVYSGVMRLSYHVIRRVTALLCRSPIIFDPYRIGEGTW